MQASDFIIKLSPLIEGLVNREWTDIDRILEKEGEIKVAFQATLNNRETAPGEQADKSNLLRVNISFAERFTASAECELVSHPELPLSYSGPVHTPVVYDDEGNEIPPDAGLSSPGAEDAGSTPLGDLIDGAASQTAQPPLNIAVDEPGWNVGGLRTDVRVKAKKAKWSGAAISLLVDLIDACGDDLDKVKETIRPHTIAAQAEAVA